MGALAIVATLLTVLLQAVLQKPPLLTSVYLANLTTYYWLAPYFLVCFGIIRIIRRERARAPLTVAAALVAMTAIGYVAVQMFLSPVDAGTRVLPYLALASILAAALAFLATRRNAKLSQAGLESL